MTEYESKMLEAIEQLNRNITELRKSIDSIKPEMRLATELHTASIPGSKKGKRGLNHKGALDIWRNLEKHMHETL